MVKVTDDKELKETVVAGLKRNKEKYGKFYCPCSVIRNDDTVCQCKEFKEMESGWCHCQLFYKFKTGEYDWYMQIENHPELKYPYTVPEINIEEWGEKK